MNGLMRDPAEWAAESGWISPRKARNDAAKLRELATTMRDTFSDDEGGAVEFWARECERIAKRLDPRGQA